MAEMPKEFKDLLGLAAIGGSVLGGIAALAAIPLVLGVGGIFAFNWLMSDSLETRKKKLLKECKKIKPKICDKIRDSNERIKDQANKFMVLIDGAINDLTSDLIEV